MAFHLTERQAVYAAAKCQAYGTKCIAMPVGDVGGPWAVYRDADRAVDMTAEAVDLVASAYAFS
ncbi:hypothetical protein ABT160_23735 [Streptomyces sp. NPDC001941]|uniref:hypothetical protein n=1 Tax=Streptomyces sp. NPDC001941 TaxID=3154659 RepID=UPI00332607EE